MKSLELKIPPLVLVVACVGLMATADKHFPAFEFDAEWVSLPGWILLVAGIGFVFAGVRAFRRHDTTLSPIDPASSSVLVSSGVYRLSRNPMYLGFVLVLLALALMYSNWLAFLVPPLFVLYMNRFQIAPEERALSAQFGAQYSQYMTEVRRWL